MAGRRSVCYACGVQEDQVPGSGKFKLSLCLACHMVAYCGRECQVMHWKQHKPNCKAVVAAVKSLQNGNAAGESAERRRIGTSVNGQLNQQAERLAQEARGHKRESRYDKAICLYTQAIQLDPYNHTYFHHRGETWMMGVQHFKRLSPAHRGYLGLAITDAQRALDLDPSDDVPWLTMIRASLEDGNLDSAQKFLDMALGVVPESAWARPYLVNYKSELEHMQMMPSLPQIIVVSDQKDDLFFGYTHGFHNHAKKPELIAIDLQVTKGGTSHGQQLMLWVSQQALAGSIALALGDVYQLPSAHGGHWLSAIPVSVMGSEAEVTRKAIIELLGAAQAASSIVVIKVDYKDSGKGSPPSPMSESQAKEFLQTLANNAAQVQSLYSKGIKLVTVD